MVVVTPALTDEMRQLLERGAATLYGRICFPFEARKIVPVLNEMRELGLLFWGDNGETPIITEAGRRAVNGPSATELTTAEMRAHSWESLR